jgi:hypothetical protein
VRWPIKKTSKKNEIGFCAQLGAAHKRIEEQNTAAAAREKEVAMGSEELAVSHKQEVQKAVEEAEATTLENDRNMMSLQLRVARLSKHLELAQAVNKPTLTQQPPSSSTKPSSPVDTGTPAATKNTSQENQYATKPDVREKAPLQSVEHPENAVNQLQRDTEDGCHQASRNDREMRTTLLPLCVHRMRKLIHADTTAIARLQ